MSIKHFAYTKPSLFVSLVMGIGGPIWFVFAWPRYRTNKESEQFPLSYPRI